MTFTKKQKKKLRQIAIGVALFIVSLLLPLKNFDWYVQIIPYIITYIVLSYKVIKKSFKNILNGNVFDENFLMVVASIGAFFTGEYPEAVAVMLFFNVGEFFEDYAVNKSRKSITSLMNIRPDTATIEVDGQLKQVSPEELKIGDVITVSAGEKIAIDGEVIEGSSSVDTSAITGESVPRCLSVGDKATSG